MIFFNKQINKLLLFKLTPKPLQINPKIIKVRITIFENEKFSNNHNINYSFINKL